MSLIALRNFSAPFTHKASLVTLALVVLLFGILRLSMGTSGSIAPRRGFPDLRDSRALPGGSDIRSGESLGSVSAITQGSVSQVSGGQAPARSAPQAARGTGEQRGGSMTGMASASFFGGDTTAPTAQAKQPDVGSFSTDDVLTEMLGADAEKRGSSTESSQANQAKSPERSNGLDAIERRLGMR